MSSFLTYNPQPKDYNVEIKKITKFQTESFKVRITVCFDKNKCALRKCNEVKHQK